MRCEEMKEKLLEYLIRQKRFMNENKMDKLDKLNDGKHTYWDGYEDAIKVFEDKVQSL